MIEKCPCRRKKCKRHGNCVECREYHDYFKRKHPVACEKKASQTT